jgi:hypothetical protein
MHTNWPRDLLELAKWALQSEDLRHRFIHSDTPQTLAKTPGIADSLETNIVFAIFEAALAKGYRRPKTIDYEKPYPNDAPVNPKRADLAFKDPGVGTKWAYVEVKRYGKAAVEGDIEKLKTIIKKSQRWMLVYRIKSAEHKSEALRGRLRLNFKGELKIYGNRRFNTITEGGAPGICEIVLARVIK